ncbi:MAG: glycosyl transferase [Spirochaetaceae bacterium]|jgi:mannosyltransferase OCH1-like enzyme|nr:glycosyl transferase [Spirochaetaceae bacterium]
MIPKIIHYCWLSGDPFPAEYQRCMDTWKAKLPDYEFILWDTQRFDIHSVAWTKQASETQLYACAADYIRLYAVYTYGGIYLDTDMEVVKPFDDLLDSGLMLAYENHISENLEAGCFGAEKGHPYIKKCLEYFEGRNLFAPALLSKIQGLPKAERHDFISPLLSPEIMKQALDAYVTGAKPVVFPNDYFTARNIVTGEIEATGNTYTIHHFGAQYHSKEWRMQRELEQRTYVLFGERQFKAKIIVALVRLFHRLDTEGFGKTVKYYFCKKILRRKVAA